MIKTLRNFFSILSKEQLFFFYKLQILIAISSILEIISIGSLAIYLSMILNANINLSIFDTFIQYYDLGRLEIVLYSGISIIILFLFSTITNILSIKYQNSFTLYVGSDFSQRLYNFYLNQDYLYFVNNDTSIMLKKITADVQRFTDQFLRGLVTALSKVLICLMIFIVLLFYNFKISIIAFFLIFFFYAITRKLFRKKVDIAGKDITHQLGFVYDYISNTLSGIRETIYYDRTKFLKQQVRNNFNEIAKNFVFLKTIGNVPKYVIELFSFTILIIIISVFLYFQTSTESMILNLAIFGSAGYKLLPTMQAIYYALTDLNGHRDSFETIYDELQQDINSSKISKVLDEQKIQIKKISSIKFNEVSFAYNQKKTINKINLSFKENQKIGIVGKSGSGKSTIIDLLLGFINPIKGSILVNDKKVQELSLKSIRNLIGFVSQNIFLFNDTISKNISIDKEYNAELIDKLSRICLLNDFLEGNNIDINNDKIGNYGKSLSGGQKQRIGIARALYNNPKVLILDEATSALDTISQNKILSNIFEFTSVSIIILITHNTNLLKNFNNIYLLDSGEIVDQGNFNKLSTNNLLFKELTVDKDIKIKL